MKKDINIFISEKIKDLREKNNISQEALSLRSGLNKAYVGHIERCYKKPTLETLEKICSQLNIHLSDFFKDY